MEVNERVGKQSSTVVFTDDAVGVGKRSVLPLKETEIVEKSKKNNEKEEKHWYIGIVPPRHEKKIKANLESVGIVSYVAAQEEIRTWSQGRKRKIEVVVIPSKLFVFCTDKERHDVLNLHLGILRFLVNRAGTIGQFGSPPLAIIPNKQMEALQKMLHYSPVSVKFNEYSFVKGDMVRIQSGVLKGIEGIVNRLSQNKSKICININGLGSAYIEVDRNTIEITKKQ